MAGLAGSPHCHFSCLAQACLYGSDVPRAAKTASLNAQALKYLMISHSEVTDQACIRVGRKYFTC